MLFFGQFWGVSSIFLHFEQYFCREVSNIQENFWGKTLWNVYLRKFFLDPSEYEKSEGTLNKGNPLKLLVLEAK